MVLLGRESREAREGLLALKFGTIEVITAKRHLLKGLDENDISEDLLIGGT